LPDFSMCKNYKCEKSQDCLRFLSEASSYQSYMCGKDECKKENGYEYFIEVKRLKVG